jgi:hypothetical protein
VANYTGETSRPLEVTSKEHKHNLTQGLLEESKLTQHAHEKCQMVLERSEDLAG